MLLTRDRAAFHCPNLRILLRGTDLTLTTLFASFVASAQSGQNGLNAAITEVSGYFQLGVTLMYAIGSVVGLVGAVKVFNKWNSGDQDTSKVAASWFGSCIFLIVVAAILQGFFVG